MLVRYSGRWTRVKQAASIDQGFCVARRSVPAMRPSAVRAVRTRENSGLRRSFPHAGDALAVGPAPGAEVAREASGDSGMQG